MAIVSFASGRENIPIHPTRRREKSNHRAVRCVVSTVGRARVMYAEELALFDQLPFELRHPVVQLGGKRMLSRVTEPHWIIAVLVECGLLPFAGSPA